MKDQIIVISNMDDNTYFFSKNHCQNHGLGDKFVPCTHYIPSYVAPRKSVPDGIVKNVSDLVAVFYDDMEEIPNPDKEMQPTFVYEL
jgi:hypothetical protein